MELLYYILSCVICIPIWIAFIYTINDMDGRKQYWFHYFISVFFGIIPFMNLILPGMILVFWIPIGLPTCLYNYIRYRKFTLEI
jgi:hypothetical protein